MPELPVLVRLVLGDNTAGYGNYRHATGGCQFELKGRKGTVPRGLSPPGLNTHGIQNHSQIGDDSPTTNARLRRSGMPSHSVARDCPSWTVPAKAQMDCPRRGRSRPAEAHLREHYRLPSHRSGASPPSMHHTGCPPFRYHDVQDPVHFRKNVLDIRSTGCILYC